MTPHATALGLGIVCTATAHVLLRLGARGRAAGRRLLLNPYTLAGYGLFVFITMLNVFALQAIPLKTVTAWTALTYVVTPLLSRAVLREPLNKGMLAGSALILAGIVVFSLGN